MFLCRQNADMSWHVYIAQAPTGRYYTGISEDPKQRIVDHNEGRGTKFSPNQGKLRLIYVSIPFADKSSARLREMQIKGWTRAKKEKLIRGEWK
jgi:predicted GIY-YIG superfamily endonuclease